MPTVLRPSDLSESSLPPKTVSIYKLPNFIEVQQRAGLPVNPHLVFFHQLLIHAIKTLRFGLACGQPHADLIFTPDKNSYYSGWRCGWIWDLFFIQLCLLYLAVQQKSHYLLAGWGPAVMICLLSGVFARQS